MRRGNCDREERGTVTVRRGNCEDRELIRQGTEDNTL